MDKAQQSDGQAARERLLNFAYACFVVLWPFVYVYYVVKKFQDRSLFFSFCGNTVHISDFTSFYQAGQMALSSSRYHVYDPQVQALFTDRIIAPIHLQQVFFCQIVPFLFPFLTLIALLPINIAYLLWTLFGLGLGFLGAYALSRSASCLKTVQIVLLLAGAFASLQNFANLMSGQFGWIITGIICLYWCFLLSDKWLLAGAMLALSTIKPHYSLFLAIPAFVKKRWLVISYAFVVEFLLLLLAACTIGLHNVLSYPSTVLFAEGSNNYAGVNPAYMISVRSLFAHFVPTDMSLYLSLIVMVVGMLLIIAAWLKSSTHEQQRWASAITVVTCIVASPHSHMHDGLILTAAAILTLPTINLCRAVRLQPISTKIWSTGFLLYPLACIAVLIYREISGNIDFNIVLPWQIVLLICGFVHIYSRY